MTLDLARLSPIWLCFALSFAVLLGLAKRGRARRDFAVLWMLASVFVGAMFMLIAELASAFSALNRTFVLTAWLLVDVALFIALARMGSVRALFAGEAARWLGALKARSAAGKCLLALIAAFAALIGWFAFRTPTTIWDCQTYHLPRIMHWIQQGSLRHYPTNIERQLESAPGSEIQMAEVMLLAGDDQAINLPEWWGWLTGAISAGYLTRLLLEGAQRRKPPADAQAAELAPEFAMVVALAMPAAVTEAVTPQNNVLVAMWMGVAVALGWLFVRDERNPIYLLGAAAALALGISVKHTMFLYAAPFAALLAVFLFWRRRWAAPVRFGLASLLLIAVIDGPWMARNARLFGNPLGPKRTYAMQRIAHNSPARVAANMLRNLTFYTRSPSDIATSLAGFSLEWMTLQIGEPVDDPDALFPKTGFYPIKKADIKQGQGLGDCYTVSLLALAVIVCPFRFKLKSPLTAHIVAVAAGFVLFCGYLRYQPWHPRLHLAYFLLASPFIAAVLCGWVDRWIALLTSSFLIFNAVLCVVVNPLLPVLSREPRENLYFVAWDGLRKPTQAVADLIVKSGCANVLLKIGDDTWEYPLWITLRDRGFAGTIQHVGVTNQSAACAVASPPAGAGAVLLFTVDPGAMAQEYPRRVTFGLWTACFKTP